MLCGQKLHLLNTNGKGNASEARCLDGTPAGFYLEQGHDSTRWVIWLQGGGVCSSMQDCKDREVTDLGSSWGWYKRREGGSAGDALMSNSESDNPDFHSWNRVYIPCVSYSPEWVPASMAQVPWERLDCVCDYRCDPHAQVLLWRRLAWQPTGQGQSLCVKDHMARCHSLFVLMPTVCC